MVRNYSTKVAYQAFAALWLLTYVCLGFVLAWAIFFLEDPRGGQKPGINIKELYREGGSR